MPNKPDAANNDREQKNKRTRFKGTAIPVPIGAIVLYMIAWISLGVTLGVIVSELKFEKRTNEIAKEENDIYTTVGFLRNTFLMNPSNFVNPSNEKIAGLAKKYNSTRDIYYFVKGNIKYNRLNGLPSDIATLSNKESSCYGMAALVVSLLRATGVPSQDTHVAVGIMDMDKFDKPHAWAQVKTGGEWKVIDPTSFTTEGNNIFSPETELIMPRDKYLKPWINPNLLFEYNDKSFRLLLDKE